MNPEEKHNPISMHARRERSKRMERCCRLGQLIGVVCVGCHLNAEEPAVEAFKKYFASVPCFTRIIYSEVTCSNTLVRTHHAAYCGDSFFVRRLTGGENIDYPISSTNRNRSPLYVGKLGDTRWQISGYQMSVSMMPDLNKPDPYTRMSDAMKIMVGGIVCFGSQHVEPGTFVWSGNKFTAQASALARRHGFEQFEGEITVEKGKVTKMVIPGSGAWAYRYSEDANIPFGLPSEFTTLGENDSCLQRVAIREMLEGQPSAQVFDPRAHIVPEITIQDIWSNGVEVLRPKANETVIQMLREEDNALLQKRYHGRHVKRGITIAVMCVITVCSIAWALRKRAYSSM